MQETINPMRLEQPPLFLQKEGTSLPLYQAQSKAIAAIKPQWFPCYTEEYVQSQKGIQGGIVRTYSKCYNVVALVGKACQTTISAIAFPFVAAGIFLFGSIANRISNAVFPINPVNGKRHFIGIPRAGEKFLGDNIIYPLATCHYFQRNPTSDAVANKVNRVFLSLQKANTELLNPKTEKVKFDYRVNTLQSSQINAFAAPGGGVAIFSALAERLEYMVQNKRINTAKVQFADGSVATVDLSAVTYEDVLSAVLGHEMTHAASRHSITLLISSLFGRILGGISRLIFMNYLKANDADYQRFKNKSQLTEAETLEFKKKQNSYAKLNGTLSWVEEKILSLVSLFTSRRHEYEADVTGAYFAQQAGFNPLGALYLQEVLKADNPVLDFLHKHLEFTFTHPYGENRKRAILVGINEMNPEVLKGRITWDLVENGYDLARSGTAIGYAHQAATATESA